MKVKGTGVGDAATRYRAVRLRNADLRHASRRLANCGRPALRVCDEHFYDIMLLLFFFFKQKTAYEISA